MAQQVASALEAAHAAGIVHRDVKPENVIARPDGLVKVLDFGLAKLAGASDQGAEAEAPSLLCTKPGAVMGTVFYMSPEQARGLDADHRADLFAFGVILFHVAFGLPFAIFLLRNFFIGIPKDLIEAARIDGASELRIFLRVILPLGLPAIAALAIFQFLWVWNDLLVALTFAQSTQPITVAIFSQLRQFGANIELIAPAAFLSMAIPLAVFGALYTSQSVHPKVKARVKPTVEIIPMVL